MKTLNISTANYNEIVKIAKTIQSNLQDTVNVLIKKEIKNAIIDPSCKDKRPILQRQTKAIGIKYETTYLKLKSAQTASQKSINHLITTCIELWHHDPSHK